MRWLAAFPAHNMEATETQLGRDKSFTDTNNNSNNGEGNGSNSSNSNNRSEEKYGLRPRTIIKRLQQERTRQDVPKRPTKSKSRPAPLSKYRRKTANARERHRMREINNAFESLRKVLPEAAEVKASTSTITKIMTLRLAVEYIKALSYVLKDDAHTGLCSFESSLHDTIQSSLQSCLQHSLQHHPLQKNLPPQHQGASYPNQRPLQLLGHCVAPDVVSASSSPSTIRGSVSSTSDLEELLSDDSGLLEETFDVFHDLPALTAADPFDILLAAERDSIAFPAELCN